MSNKDLCYVPCVVANSDIPNMMCNPEEFITHFAFALMVYIQSISVESKDSLECGAYLAAFSDLGKFTLVSSFSI